MYVRTIIPPNTASRIHTGKGRVGRGGNGWAGEKSRVERGGKGQQIKGSGKGGRGGKGGRNGKGRKREEGRGREGQDERSGK